MVRATFSHVLTASVSGVLGVLLLGACATAPAFSSEFARRVALNSGPLCSSRHDALYPVPWSNHQQLDVALPAGHRLQDAWLEIDDREGAADSVRRLVSGFSPEPGVTLTAAESGSARLIFDLAFYKPGLNRFALRAVAAPEQDGATRVLAPLPIEVEYRVPDSFGLGAGGALSLPSDDFPRRMRDCHGAACKDADGDGLNDLWENVALEQLRPYLMLDRGDTMLRRQGQGHTVRVLSSATPLYQGQQEYVIFASVIAFTRDYGFYGLLKHAGDTEAFGMLYRVDPDGALRWVTSIAKGHGCLFCAPRYGLRTQDFAPNGVPLLYVEKDKHGVWQNQRACRTHAAFSCRADRSLRPPMTNIGDPSSDGSGALVDALDGVNRTGPFSELAGIFPGDAIWTASRARVPGRFCGGPGRCDQRNSANQPGTVIRQLQQLLAARTR